MLRFTSSVACMLLALCLFSGRAVASDDAIWWGTAARDAEENGYKLIDTKGLKDLLKAGGDVLVIDARADYEFEAGHIPGSANLEFDLGDKLGLPDAKRATLGELAGPDKKRTLVLYCRSFR
ncbi:MAG: rhodanese-like domain-containing protein [Pseudodesulfovibrio sp.]